MSEMFDRLAKAAAGGVSRRGALKGLAGFLAGGFLLGLTGKARAEDKDDNDDDDHNEEINERCQKYCAPCRGHAGDAHGDCIEGCKKALRKNPKAVLCGACSAAAPLTVCTGASSCCTPKTGAPYCVNFNTDAKNCGKCGNACAKGQTCVKGVCT